MSTASVKYFDVAKAVSKLSDFKRIHIGCVIVDGKHIIATGQNTNKTHPMQKEYNRYRFHADCIGNGKLHAEMMAILNLRPYLKSLDLSKVSIYVYRENRFGELRMSRPCSSCMAKIKELGIRHIYYTSADGYCYERLKYD